MILFIVIIFNEINMSQTSVFILSVFLFYFNVHCTIDINLSELEHLSDHLTPEECRKLVAAAHFQSYALPPALPSAEEAISKDIPCLRLLLHWNSQEGRGETHEVLEHRLRQIGRIDLADWLGRTVFEQLGRDLNAGLRGDSLHELATEKEISSTMVQFFPTLEPVIESATDNLEQWTAFDTLCYSALVLILVTSSAICCKLTCGRFSKKKRKLTGKVHDIELKQFLEDSSDSETKFDVRGTSDSTKL